MILVNGTGTTNYTVTTIGRLSCTPMAVVLGFDVVNGTENTGYLLALVLAVVASGYGMTCTVVNMTDPLSFGVTDRVLVITAKHGTSSVGDLHERRCVHHPMME
jgi:hypothetical protein